MYNRLFTKILDSSIWMEDWQTRIVWITFLAMMDEDGFVALSSVQNVAHRARVEPADAEHAIQVLENPDKINPDQEHEGRRIERVPSGWMVINADKYKKMLNRITLLEANRQRVARHRAAKKEERTKEETLKDKSSSHSYSGVMSGNTDVMPCNDAPDTNLLQDFNADEAFEKLCQVYRKAERGYAVQTAFCEAVDWVAAKHKFNLAQAASYIIVRASKYCTLEKFQKGLGNWLRDKIFEQDESVWRQGKNNGLQDLDELYADEK